MAITFGRRFSIIRTPSLTIRFGPDRLPQDCTMISYTHCCSVTSPTNYTLPPVVQTRDTHITPFINTVYKHVYLHALGNRIIIRFYFFILCRRIFSPRTHQEIGFFRIPLIAVAGHGRRTAATATTARQRLQRTSRVVFYVYFRVQIDTH